MRLRRRTGWLVVALGIYVLVLLVSPVLHHDLACHLKSPTHCDACAANPLASQVETGIGLGAPGLREAGAVNTVGARPPEAAFPIHTTGRAPPA